MKFHLLALAALFVVRAGAQAPDSLAPSVYTEKGLTDLSNPVSRPYVSVTLLKPDGSYVRSVDNRVTETGPWIYRKVAPERAELILSGQWHLLIFKDAETGTWLDVRGGSESFNTFSLAASPKVGTVANLSVRTSLRAGDTSVAGFVITDHPTAVLIRAVGPGLRGFGVPDALSRPRLRVRSTATDSIIAENAKWGDQGAAFVGVGFPTDEALLSKLGGSVGAFPLAAGSDDAAVTLVLPPGGYTIETSSVEPSQTGSALLELYLLP
jgi:hypothetical protein